MTAVCDAVLRRGGRFHPGAGFARKGDHVPLDHAAMRAARRGGCGIDAQLLRGGLRARGNALRMCGGRLRGMLFFRFCRLYVGFGGSGGSRAARREFIGRFAGLTDDGYVREHRYVVVRAKEHGEKRAVRFGRFLKRGFIRFVGEQHVANVDFVPHFLFPFRNHAAFDGLSLPRHHDRFCHTRLHS